MIGRILVFSAELTIAAPAAAQENVRWWLLPWWAKDEPRRL